MASPFDEWQLQDARVAVQLSKEDSGRLAAYRAFVAGDHWQNWKGWIGPEPLATDEDAEAVRTAIERGFVSRNALKECVGRHVNGVLGRDVKWDVVVRRQLKEGEKPKAEEQTLIDEAKALLKEWVEARKLDQEYDKLGKNLLVDGVANQRLFVPPGELSDDGTVPRADIATNLGRVYLHLPLAGEAAIYTDPRTQAKCSVYLYRETTSSRPSQANAQEGEERAELTYLDGDRTVVRIIGKDGTIGPLRIGDQDEGPTEYSYQLGNRLLMADIQREPLLNPQVVSQQKLLNLTLTMKQRNVILGGFLERVATNAQMNGAYETGSDGIRRFVPSAIPVGAGAMLNLTGYITRDADGSERLANPGMLWRDPVDVKTFIDTEESSYRHILAECNQLHYSSAGDSGISAEARQISMSAYEIDLKQTAQQLNAGWSWVLETGLALAAVLSDEAGKFDELRVMAECFVDPGPVTESMMTTTQSLTGGQPLLSVKTARGRVGVEDVDGEQQQIAKEQEERLERQVTEATAMSAIGAEQAMAKTMPQDVRGIGAGGSSANGRNGAGMPTNQGRQAA